MTPAEAIRAQVEAHVRQQMRDTEAARKRRFRDKRRQASWQDQLVWLSPEGQAALAALRQPGETLDACINRVLITAAQRPTPRTSPVPNPPPALTPDEARFVVLWEAGHEVKAIAAELGITWYAAQSRANRLQDKGAIQKRPRGGAYPTTRAQARQRPETP